MKLLFGLFCLSCSFISYSIEVTESQISQSRIMQTQDLFQSHLDLPAKDIDQFLSTLAPLERVLQTNLWLSHLARLASPSEQQRLWARSMLKSQDKLTTPNEDHPGRQIEVVNIAAQANATLTIWRINEVKTSLYQGWLKGSIDWSSWFSGYSRVQEAALISLLKELPVEQLQVFSDDVLLPRLSMLTGSNQIAAALATRINSVEVAQHLFTRKADEFSYQTLRVLPQYFGTDSAIQILTIALNNKSLNSQAILMLAGDYLHDPKAQSLMLDLLKDPKTQWLAAAALSKTQDVAFRQKIVDTYDKLDQPFARFVTTVAKESQR